jgi:NADP-dependent 3-hydroxy acid dehydrogenase YdfG
LQHIVSRKVALIADGNSGIGLATTNDSFKKGAFVFVTENAIETG